MEDGVRRTGELSRPVPSPEFWWPRFVTVVYATLTTLVKLALGLGFALLLARPFRGRALVFLAIFLPVGLPGERERDRLVLDAESARGDRVCRSLWVS